MDIESGHEEVYKPLTTTKKHAPPPESRASRRYALFLTATKVLCLLMVLSLLGYYVYVTVTMDDATAQLVRDVSKLKQHNHHPHHHNKSDDDDVPEWFAQVLNLTRMGFVHISLQPFPPEAPEPTTTTHRRPTTTTPTTTTPTTTTPTTTTPTTTTTVEPPTTTSSTTTTSTTENTPEDSTTESTTTTTTETANDIELDYGTSL